MSEPGGVLLTLAPAAAEIGHLLRAAIDAEQVGATRLHLAADQADLEQVVAALREQTGLVLTADPGSAADPLLDRITLPEVLVAPGEPAAVVAQVADIAAAHPDGVSVGGRDGAALPVLLAGLAAGAHLRVGTADAAPSGERRGGGRDDAALVARAAGLARIAGRPALDPGSARRVLGLI